MASPGSSSVPSLEEVRALPKVELHAHLGGCISQQKLVELLAKRNNGDFFAMFDCREVMMSEGGDTSKALAKCFDYFDKVSKVVCDLDTLKECTLHVLDTFAADGCLYLELRTSPKQLQRQDGGSSSGAGGQACDGSYTTKAQYLETVKEAVDKFRSYAMERFGFVMEVGILLSIDRGKVSSAEAALRQVDDVAALGEAYPDFVVGVDISGNPAQPSVVPYLIPALMQRKAVFRRLPITFHTAEIEDAEESELILQSLCDLNIRRLGHVCFFPEHCRNRVLEGGFFEDGSPLGIELCPTSNSITRRLTSLADHHFTDWWKKSDKVLLSVNTDDTGLFSCNLSSEVHDMARAFCLSRADIVELQRQALRSSFHPDKARLLAVFENLLAQRAGFQQDGGASSPSSAL